MGAEYQIPDGYLLNGRTDDLGQCVFDSLFCSPLPHQLMADRIIALVGQ